MKPDLRVVEAEIENKRDLETIIEHMRSAGLTDVFVLGYDRNGDFYSDVNFVGGANGLWLLEMAKKKILKT